MSVQSESLIWLIYGPWIGQPGYQTAQVRKPNVCHHTMFPFFRGAERPPTAHDNQLRSKSTEISTNINAIERKSNSLDSVKRRFRGTLSLTPLIYDHKYG